jgi:PQQ-dependent dehydrogenase (s-GDH family)
MNVAALGCCCLLLGRWACSQPPSGGGPAAAGSPNNAAPGGASGTAAGGGGRSGTASSAISPANGASFAKRVVLADLANPWSISWGPDGWLWVTERSSKRVVRVQPSDGVLHVALALDEVRTEGLQDGLLGMALHPQLLAGTNQDFVYVAYSYDATSGRRFKIRRYTYAAASETLSAPLDVLTELPASSDHNGGRLRLGPDNKLYYTVGDQGENQFERKCNLDRAQELPTAEQVSARDFQAYQGKILRINLDGSIPEDNPVLSGVRSHVYSYGHRNPQGIAFGASGVLFSSEQGPKSDDELNRIEAGKNYGWPQVSGFRDDKAYVYANWSALPNCQQIGYSDYTLPASIPQQTETGWNDPNLVEPLMTFYTVESDHPFQDPQCGAHANICWPTIAPSSLAFYSAANQALTGWTNSLLVTSLKQGTVYRVPLSADGKATAGDATPLFKTTNRYRDVALNPDGQAFYVLTDSQGFTASPDGGATDSLENPGSVLEFRARR